jgi:outer membrane protein assembly factor BamB
MIEKSVILFFVFLFVSMVSGADLPSMISPPLEVVVNRAGYSVVPIGEEFLLLIGGFYHPNQGGQPVAGIDVLASVNGTFIGSLNTTLPTPRGNMSCVLLNNLIFTIGGSQSLTGSDPLTTIEVLELPSSYSTLSSLLSATTWSQWQNLSLPRLNPLTAIFEDGIVVAFGGLESSLAGVCEFISTANQSTFNFYSLPIQALSTCNQQQSLLVSVNDNSTSLALLCPPSPFFFVFDLSSTEWIQIVNPLTQQYPSLSFYQLVSSPEDTIIFGEVYNGGLFFQMTGFVLYLHTCYKTLSCEGQLSLSLDGALLCLVEYPPPNTTSGLVWPVRNGSPQQTHGNSMNHSICYPAGENHTYIQTYTHLNIVGHFVIDQNGNSYMTDALSLSSVTSGGDERWSRLNIEMTGSNILALDALNEVLYLGTLGVIYALNTGTGELLWEDNSFTGQVSSINMPSPQQLILTTYTALPIDAHQKVVSISVSSHDVLWERDVSIVMKEDFFTLEGFYPVVAVNSELFFAVTNSSELIALSLNKGAHQWSLDIPFTILNLIDLVISPTSSDIYLSLVEGTVICVDTHFGLIKWQQSVSITTGAKRQTLLAVDTLGSLVFVTSLDMDNSYRSFLDLTAMYTKNGSIRWENKLSISIPAPSNAVVQNMMFAPDGRLLIYGIGIGDLDAYIIAVDAYSGNAVWFDECNTMGDCSKASAEIGLGPDGTIYYLYPIDFSFYQPQRKSIWEVVRLF